MPLIRLTDHWTINTDHVVEVLYGASRPGDKATVKIYLSNRGADPVNVAGTDAAAVWDAIRAHVEMPPISIGRAIEDGMESIQRRIDEMERRIEMAEQQAADADDFDVLQGRVERLEKLAAETHVGETS